MSRSLPEIDEMAYSICFCLSNAARISPTVVGLVAAILAIVFWMVKYSLMVGRVRTAT